MTVAFDICFRARAAERSGDAGKIAGFRFGAARIALKALRK